MLLISGTYERRMKICHCLKVDFGAFALSLIAILFSHLVDFSNHFLSSLKSVSSSTGFYEARWGYDGCMYQHAEAVLEKSCRLWL